MGAAPWRPAADTMTPPASFVIGASLVLQRLLTRGPWNTVDVQREVQAVAAQRLTRSAIQRSNQERRCGTGRALTDTVPAVAERGTLCLGRLPTRRLRP